ncbi:formylglycine-generating enzyme family protein [Oceanimonas baumannii]|uniref:formylglycine-generating enzyme family protein n=1 Tax=Oceanimonas baumannii TaxID=129578 RepID=UPI003A93CF40
MSLALLLSMALLPSVSQMAELPAGEVRPLYLTKESPLTPVAPFKLDITPVTNQQFAAFVAAHPQWQRGRPAPLFTEPAYLQHWPGPAPAAEQHQQPVTFISWFAADAYCRAQGKRLPTVAEWEYAAQASSTAANGTNEPGFTRYILDWYARPATAQLSQVGQHAANYWQVHDLHGLVWEWTHDFNSALVTGESRGDSSLDQSLFCGSASAGSADPSDYAAFMRYGFRSSLKATYALGNLGFRCAKETLNEDIRFITDVIQP